jgi:hypothetical protein
VRSSLADCLCITVTPNDAVAEASATVFLVEQDSPSKQPWRERLPDRYARAPAPNALWGERDSGARAERRAGGCRRVDGRRSERAAPPADHRADNIEAIARPDAGERVPVGLDRDGSDLRSAACLFGVARWCHLALSRGGLGVGVPNVCGMNARVQHPPNASAGRGFACSRYTT